MNNDVRVADVGDIVQFRIWEQYSLVSEDPVVFSVGDKYTAGIGVVLEREIAKEEMREGEYVEIGHYLLSVSHVEYGDIGIHQNTTDGNGLWIHHGEIVGIQESSFPVPVEIRDKEEA